MKIWKKQLVPALFVLGGVLCLVPAVVKPVIKGGPLNSAFIAVAFVFFTFAMVLFAAGRKTGGGSGRPSA